MAIIQTCCCWDNVRKGSFASGIFTLALYTIIFTTCAFHVGTVYDQPVIFSMSLAMLFLSGASVVSSLILIIALIADNHHLLIPWIVTITLTSIVDLIVSTYLIFDLTASSMIMFFVMDLIICAINMYGILCVISQYQEYKQGRGFANKRKTFQQRLTVQHNFLQIPRIVTPDELHKNSPNRTLANYTDYLSVPSPSICTSMKSFQMSTESSSVTDNYFCGEDEIKIVITKE